MRGSVTLWGMLVVAATVSLVRAEDAPAPSAAASSAAPAAPAPPPETVTPPTAGPTTSVKAARLALVGRTRESLIYIDKPTLRKLSPGKFDVWAEVHSDDGDRVKFLMQLNCDDRSYLVKSEVVYDAEGQVIENRANRVPALQYVVPDSAAEFIHQAICRPS